MNESPPTPEWIRHMERFQPHPLVLTYKLLYGVWKDSSTKDVTDDDYETQWKKDREW